MRPLQVVGTAILGVGTWLAVDKRSFIHLTRFSTLKADVEVRDVVIFRLATNAEYCRVNRLPGHLLIAYRVMQMNGAINNAPNPGILDESSSDNLP